MSSTPASDDAAAAELGELARRAVAGEKGATRALLIAVGPAMLRAIRKVLTRRTADIEDVAQEAMEALVTALPSFRGECTVLHFAWRVAVLTALANRRRLDLRARWAADVFELGAVEAISGDPSPAEAMALRSRSQALTMLLDELPVNQSEVLVLHAAFGFTVEEVAAAVGRPLETVRSRLRLAKQALRQRIQASPELTEMMERTS
ncbi:MAG TPA: RNA polymerase sigma factor [Polyangia bacterium]|nr:RNA polymerase sigma factor [Polyangia bacterium]